MTSVSCLQKTMCSAACCFFNGQLLSAISISSVAKQRLITSVISLRYSRVLCFSNISFSNTSNATCQSRNRCLCLLSMSRLPTLTLSFHLASSLISVLSFQTQHIHANYHCWYGKWFAKHSPSLFSNWQCFLSICCITPTCPQPQLPSDCCSAVQSSGPYQADGRCMSPLRVKPTGA